MNPNNIQPRQFLTAGVLAAAGTAPVFGTEPVAAPSHSTFCRCGTFRRARYRISLSAFGFRDYGCLVRARGSFKADRWSVTDPLSHETVPLFDPRHDVWTDHFRWSADGMRIIGLTARGRATVEALRLNHPLIVMTRDLWVRGGAHPPKP